ncbi:hypothetical protein GCM10027425_00010 [Alteromonas gracilis]
MTTMTDRVDAAARTGVAPATAAAEATVPREEKAPPIVVTVVRHVAVTDPRGASARIARIVRREVSAPTVGTTVPAATTGVAMIVPGVLTGRTAVGPGSGGVVPTPTAADVPTARGRATAATGVRAATTRSAPPTRRSTTVRRSRRRSPGASWTAT